MIARTDIASLREISTEVFLRKIEKYPPVVKMREWLTLFTKEISELNERIKVLESEIALLKVSRKETDDAVAASPPESGEHNPEKNQNVLSPETIAQIRMSFGCSVVQMAKILDLSIYYYSRLERGIVKPSSLKLEAKLLRLRYITATERREILQQYGFFRTTTKKISTLPLLHLPKSPDIRISLAELHEIKDSLGVTYYQLAELVGVTPSQVSNWFGGNVQPNQENCRRLRALTEEDVKNMPRRLHPLKQSSLKPQLKPEEISAILAQLQWTIPQLAAYLNTKEYKLKHWLSGHSVPTTRQANRIRELRDSLNRREHEKIPFTIDEFQKLKEKLEYSDYHLALLLNLPFMKVHSWSLGTRAPSAEELAKLREFYSRVFSGSFVDKIQLPRISPQKINEICERQRLRRKDLMKIMGVQANTLTRWLKGKRGPTPKENERLWILWEKPAVVQPITFSPGEIVELRKSRSLTQKQFGELIEEPEDKIRRLEQGITKITPDIDHKIRIALDLPQPEDI